MAWEGRKYKLDKSEQFDEYMKALGKLLNLNLMNFSTTLFIDLFLSCIFTIVFHTFSTTCIYLR